MKLDGKFCNCLRQSWKKLVGTLAPIYYFAHPGQITEPTSLCHHSMESLSLPLHPNLPHPPSINVGEIDETADDMTSINIAPGGRGNQFYENRLRCANIFFQDCLSEMVKKSSVFGFLALTFLVFKITAPNFT